jgi:hypothetical protein
MPIDAWIQFQTGTQAADSTVRSEESVQVTEKETVTEQRRRLTDDLAEVGAHGVALRPDRVDVQEARAEYLQ